MHIILKKNLLSVSIITGLTTGIYSWTHKKDPIKYYVPNLKPMVITGSKWLGSRVDIENVQAELEQKNFSRAAELAENLIFVKFIDSSRQKKVTFTRPWSKVGTDQICDKVSGLEPIDHGFCRQYGNTYKLLHKYQIGIQEPLIPFDPDTDDTCSAGGLYLTYAESINDYTYIGTDIVQATIPIDSNTQIVSSSDKFRVNKMRIESIDKPGSFGDLIRFGIHPREYIRNTIGSVYNQNASQIEMFETNFIIDVLYELRFSKIISYCKYVLWEAYTEKRSVDGVINMHHIDALIAHGLETLEKRGHLKIHQILNEVLDDRLLVKFVDKYFFTTASNSLRQRVYDRLKSANLKIHMEKRYSHLSLK
jgi:hypothetical protein